MILPIARRAARWLTAWHDLFANNDRSLMRRRALAALLVLSSTALAACSQSTVSRVDDRTFQIEGPQVPGGSDVPNQRLAAKLCPQGYRVLDSVSHKIDPTISGALTTFWTIRCL